MMIVSMRMWLCWVLLGILFVYASREGEADKGSTERVSINSMGAYDSSTSSKPKKGKVLIVYSLEKHPVELDIEEGSVWINFEVYPTVHCPKDFLNSTKTLYYVSSSFEFHPYSNIYREKCTWQLGTDYPESFLHLPRDAKGEVVWSTGPPRLPAVVLTPLLPTARHTVPPFIVPFDNITHLFHHVYMKIQYMLTILPGGSSLFVAERVSKDFSNFMTEMADSFLSANYSTSLTSSQWGILFYDLLAYYEYMEYTVSVMIRTYTDVDYLAAMTYTVERYPMIAFPWKMKHLSLVFIIDTPCISPTCQVAHHTGANSPYQVKKHVQKLLEGLRDEIDDIQDMFNVYILYGYAHYPDEHSQYERDCKFLQTLFHPVMKNVVCLGKDMTPTPSRAEDRRYEDVRESIANYAYDLTKADYYWFLDLENTVRIKNPAIMSTLTYLYHGKVVDKFGAVFQHAFPFSSKSTTAKLRNDLNLYYPFSPILASAYFKMNQGIERTLRFAPKAMNNYLWLEMFELVDGVKFCENNFIKQFSTPLVKHYQEHVEEYMLQLVANRRMLLAYLHQDIFTESDEVDMQTLFEADGSLFTSKVFHEMLCGMYFRQELLNQEVLHMAETYCIEVEDDYLEDSYGETDAEVVVMSNGALETEQSAAEELHQSLALASLPLNEQIPQYAAISLHYQFDGKDWESKVGKELIVLPTAKLYNNYDTTTKKTRAKVAVITAMFGDYEKTFKPFSRQSIATDFICFTDMNISQENDTNGWIINRIPYHLEAIDREFREGLSHEVNAFVNNQHPFNVAKYYKTSFHRISFLQAYDVVIWVDGTVRIVDEHMSRRVLQLFEAHHVDHPMITFEHIRRGDMMEEAKVSNSIPKYASTEFSGIKQPIQDVGKQYQDYLALGYNVQYWQEYLRSKGWEYRINYGMWCTCFVAFNMTDVRSPDFLSAWNDHIRKYSTQDQVSFPFISQQYKMHPYSLPDNDTVRGFYDFNTFFVKLSHFK